MEHPPKQGLKRGLLRKDCATRCTSFNGTSTKTRIETNVMAAGAKEGARF